MSVRRPRVLYCTDTYPPQVNGVSVVTAHSVAGLRARGWDVGVVAPRYPDFPPPGVRTFLDDFGGAERYVPLPSVAFPPYPDIRIALPAYRRIGRVMDEFTPDVVHCATEFVIGRVAETAAARRGLPLVTSYHTDFSRYAAAYGVPWLQPVVSRYIARFHRRAARTFTPSDMARADLLELGVRDVEVWGRTVDTTVFHPERRTRGVRQGLGIDDTIVFLHVGRLAAEKGIHWILEAFRLARSESPELPMHLVIAGGGPEEEALRAAAPANVTFLGVLDRTRALPQLYASADAFVFSSLTETLGLVVLEAMASGLPVLATPAGGVADHLRHGENAIACGAADPRSLADAMALVARDRPLRARLGAGARRTAEALSWEGELDRLDASYREIIAAPASVEARARVRVAGPSFARI